MLVNQRFIESDEISINGFNCSDLSLIVVETGRSNHDLVSLSPLNLIINCYC